MIALDEICFNTDGLIGTIVQDKNDGRVLMFAWVSREALEKTIETGFAHYFSRSRQKLWMKGEESGHTQKVHHILIDCDGDALIYQVEQMGNIACHTGHRSCFYRALNGKNWTEIEPTLQSEESIYGSKK